MKKIYKEVGGINIIKFPSHQIKYFGDLGKCVLAEEPMDNISITFDGEFDFFEAYPNVSVSVFIYTTYERNFVKSYASFEDIRHIKKNQLDLELDKPLELDKEYIIKIFYNLINDDNSISTIVDNYMGYRFGYYSDADKYIMLVEPVKKPTMTFSGVSEVLNSPLTNQTIILDKKNNVITLEKFIGALIVTVDGVSMTENLDYTRTEDLLIFNDKLPMGTVINIMGSKVSNSDSGLKSEAFNISKNIGIPNEADVTEGVFYNPELDKFGVIVESPINKTTTPIVILNGAVLSSEFDYYVSEHNSSMLYLSGTLIQEDLLVVNYFPEFSTNSIDGSNFTVYGFLADAPNNDSGEVIISIADNKDFTGKYSMYILPYKKGVAVYEFNISYTKSVGVHYIKLTDKKEIISFDGVKLPFTNSTEAVKINFK